MWALWVKISERHTAEDVAVAVSSDYANLKKDEWMCHNSINRTSTLTSSSVASIVAVSSDYANLKKDEWMCRNR